MPSAALDEEDLPDLLQARHALLGVRATPRLLRRQHGVCEVPLTRRQQNACVKLPAPNIMAIAWIVRNYNELNSNTHGGSGRGMLVCRNMLGVVLGVVWV